MPAMGRGLLGPARRPHLAFVPDAELCGPPPDPEIQARVRERYADLVRQVAEATGAEPAQLWSFFANGMLLNVIAALNLEVLAPSEEWAACWVDPRTMLAGRR